MRFLIALCFIFFTTASFAQEPTSRDQYKEDLAANKDVAEVIKNFKGNGAVGEISEPTPASTAVTQFTLPDDLKIELVASEPEVMQPLYMHFDDHGRMWVVEYLQYPFPEGLKVIRYDQYLRAVFDKVPVAPPHHVRGKDQIRVFSDTNGDGTFDQSHIAIDGLNIVSSVVTGQGGIWVLNPPYLLFYPDADGDAKPDGDPVVKLSGFGLEDTHSVTNSLRWGPDGWIYAANGSTTTGNVSSNTTQKVQWEGQNIWRYHPQLDVFEIYAEGGGNTFSTEIDSHGFVFSGTNHGNTRGMFYPQGSYGEKNWGKHGPLTNPHAFGFFTHMKHEGDADRFAQTFVIYEGGTLPQRYHGNVIAANSLHNRVWASELSHDTSTYRTKDMPPVCETEDHWFRPVDVKVGPDGAVYLADWYDTRLTHVDPRDNWHKTSGRIYRIQAQATEPSSLKFDLTSKTDAELIKLFSHKNKWWRQTVVRVLGDRLLAKQAETHAATLLELVRLVSEFNPQALEALWTLHWAGEFNDALALKVLAQGDSDLRRWAIRLQGDHRDISPAVAEQLHQLAMNESDVQVRVQLASTAKRIETLYALPIIHELLKREEDQADLHQPLMLWWALEAHCGAQVASSPQLNVELKSNAQLSPREQVLQLFEKPTVWDLPLVKSVVLSRLMQRFAMDKDGADACVKLLSLAPTDEHRARLMAGFLEAYQGREIATLPADLKQAIEDYQKDIGQSDLALGLRLGQADAVKQAITTIKNTNADPALRLLLIKTLGEVNQPTTVSTLLSLLGGSHSSAIKLAAMEALMSYPNPEIGSTICGRYHSSLPNEHGLRETAHRVLASRVVWSQQLLAEVAEYRIKPAAITLDVVQQMRLHDDPELHALLDKFWGKTRNSPEEKLAEISRLRSLITSSKPRDAVSGKSLFTKHCAACHTLFNEGGKTGPNLTGYERSNLEFLLLAVADPSAAIREEFTQFQIATIDGRVLTGLLEEQTPNTLSLRGVNNQLTIINRDDVDILKAMNTSIMPDELVQKLTAQDILNLFAYLMQPTPRQ